MCVVTEKRVYKSAVLELEIDNLQHQQPHDIELRFEHLLTLEGSLASCKRLNVD